MPSSLFDAAGTFCTGRRWGGTRPTTFSDFNLLLLFSVEKSQTGVVLRLLRVAAVLVPGAGCRVPGAGCRVPGASAAGADDEADEAERDQDDDIVTTESSPGNSSRAKELLPPTSPC